MKRIILIIFSIIALSISKVYSQIYQTYAMCYWVNQSQGDTTQIFRDAKIVVNAIKQDLKVFSDSVHEFKIIKRYPSIEDEQGNINLLWDCKNKDGSSCLIRFKKLSNRELEMYLEGETFLTLD